MNTNVRGMRLKAFKNPCSNQIINFVQDKMKQPRRTRMSLIEPLCIPRHHSQMMSF